LLKIQIILKIYAYILYINRGGENNSSSPLLYLLLKPGTPILVDAFTNPVLAAAQAKIQVETINKFV